MGIYSQGDPDIGIYSQGDQGMGIYSQGDQGMGIYSQGDQGIAILIGIGFFTILLDIATGSSTDQCF